MCICIIYVYIATYTANCDYRQYIHCLVLTQSKLSVVLLCIDFKYSFISDLHKTLIILYHRQYNVRLQQNFNIGVNILWDSTRHDINVHYM